MSTLETVAVADAPIQMTAAALRKIADLVALDGNPQLMLRISVSGGGCSGMQYGFAFDEGTEDGDLLIDGKSARVLIDPISLPYLEGATVDYRENLQGAQFVVSNPNAQTTCGCGSSFTVA